MTFQSFVSTLLIYALALTPSLDAQFSGLGKALPIPGLNPSDALNKLLEDRVGKMLGGELPLTLDATHTYPTISDAELPGGPFKGKPLTLTLETLTTPLPPGDYVVLTTFFVHNFQFISRVADTPTRWVRQRASSAQPSQPCSGAA